MTADTPSIKTSPHCLSCGGSLDSRETGLFDTRFGVPGAWSVAACGSCGLEQLAPPPSQEELDRLYERRYNFGGERGTSYTSLRSRFFRSSLYRIWIAIDGDIFFHNIKGSGRLLDIGCNEGRGLRFHRRNGWEAEGLETNPVAAAEARRRGFTVHVMPVREFAPGRLYDAVVLSNVLEHSLDPRDLLRHARRLLNAGGRLWVSAPNGASALRSVFGRSWIHWHVPFHVVHFTGRTLQRVLEEAGFDVLSMRQETPALWAAQSLITRVFAHRGSPTRQLRSPALVAPLILCIRGFLFPLMWLANRSGKGDCLVIEARRARCAS